MYLQYFVLLCLTALPIQHIEAHNDSLRRGAVVWDITIAGMPTDSGSQHSVAIPFRMLGNLMLVEAEVNTLKGWFVLDSGAPDLKLNAKYFEVGVPISDGREAGGVTGSVSNLSLQTVRQFRWHQYTLEQVRVESFDLYHLEEAKGSKILGLIGYQLFKDLEIMPDYRRFRLMMYQLDSQGERLDAASYERKPDYQIPFKMAGFIPVIEAEIGGEKLSFGLDTGAELNILDNRLSAKVMQHFAVQRRALLNGNGTEKVEVLTGKIDEIRVQNLPYKNMRTVLTNMRSMNKHYQRKLDGILGFEFLYPRLCAINFRKRTLSIWEISPPKMSNNRHEN